MKKFFILILPILLCSCLVHQTTDNTIVATNAGSPNWNIGSNDIKSILGAGELKYKDFGLRIELATTAYNTGWDFMPIPVRFMRSSPDDCKTKESKTIYIEREVCWQSYKK